MKVDSKKVEEVLKVFSKTLEDLGIRDFVLSTLTEDQDGKVQYQTVFEGDEVTIAHILMNLEEEAPEGVQNHIAKHQRNKVVEALINVFGGDQDAK